jgi:outer membrane protein W
VKGGIAVFGLAMLLASSSNAQERSVSFRPFLLASDERFAAQTTFKAVFGSATEAAWGGGVDVTVGRHVFVDLAISRMSQSGQRAFINNGQVFALGIPLRVTLTPVELTAGYRFRRRNSRIIPYVGAGIGWYQYRETADFAAAGDDTDVSHTGFVMMGGAEFRITKWIGVTGDAQYTSVSGILGQGGLSKDAGESDLGGVAARLRVIIGR